jgi:site-specific DNA-methyltransferase (adenine-specific)
MNVTDKIRLFNVDCMEFMASVPDKYYELAIVDPPYGIGVDGQKLNNKNKNPKHNRKAHDFKGWDNAIPSAEYFNQLFRVSKNQIIWGGNYFTEYLKPTKAWIFWYKGQNDLTMSDGEMAWTSFDTVTRQFDINRGLIAKHGGSIHPTQKPVALYKWLLDKYAKPTDKILDTHGGSMSIAIAAHDYDFELDLCELDKDYYEKGVQRVKNHVSQQKLF